MAEAASAEPVSRFVLVLSAAVLVIGLSHWTITSYEHDDEHEVQVAPLTVEFNSTLF